MRRLPWTKRRRIFEGMKHVPTEGQLKIHEGEGNRVIMAGGVRAGKSEVLGKEMAAHVACATTVEGLKEVLRVTPPEQHEALIKSMSIIKEGEFFVLGGPTFEAPQTEFRVALRALKRLGLVVKSSTPKTGAFELQTKFGTILATRTLSDPEEVRAWNCAGVGICEAGKVLEDSYLAILQRVFGSDGFVILTGTLEESQPWYQEYLQEWSKQEGKFSISLPSWSNNYVFPGGEWDEKITELAAEYGGRDSPLFLTKVAAKLVKPTGLVISQFNYDMHVRDVRWSGGDVELAIDPGTRHTYAVEVIQSGPHGQTQVIDEIYRRGWVTEQVIAYCRDKPWWRKVAGGVIDRTAADSRGHTKTTTWQLWRDAGVHLRSKYVLVQDGVDRTNAALGLNPATGEPKLLINPNCKGLIYEFGGLGKPPFPGMGPWKRVEGGDGAYGKPQNIDDDASKTIGYWLVDKHGKLRPEQAVVQTRYSSGATWRR